MADLTDHPEMLPLLARVQDDEARAMLTEILARLFTQRDSLRDQLREAVSQLGPVARALAECHFTAPPMSAGEAKWLAAGRISLN